MARGHNQQPKQGYHEELTDGAELEADWPMPEEMRAEAEERARKILEALSKASEL